MEKKAGRDCDTYAQIEKLSQVNAFMGEIYGIRANEIYITEYGYIEQRGKGRGNRRFEV